MSPAVAAYVPLMQSEQLPPVPALPAEHWMQEEAPALGEEGVYPSVHEIQADRRLAPAEALYLPTGHAIQSPVPATA